MHVIARLMHGAYNYTPRNCRGLQRILQRVLVTRITITENVLNLIHFESAPPAPSGADRSRTDWNQEGAGRTRGGVKELHNSLGVICSHFSSTERRKETKEHLKHSHTLTNAPQCTERTRGI